MYKEIWKDIIGYEGKYQVSNLGRIKSLIGGNGQKRELILKPYCKKYCTIRLIKNNKKKNFRIHRLVAIAFIPNPNNYLYINHKDENPHNNNVENLEWCDMAYNINYGNRTDKTKRKVNQYDLQGNFIKTWKGFMDIQRELGFSNSSIGNCCRGRVKKSNGYIWKYAEGGNND